MSINSPTTYSSNGKQYPDDLDRYIRDEQRAAKSQSQPKSLLQAIGAPGTAIMSGIIDNLSTGEFNSDFYWRDKIGIFDQMRRSDGLIAGVIRAIEQPILSADWT